MKNQLKRIQIIMKILGISDNENILNDDAPDSSIVDRDIAANMFSADNNINKSLDITDDMTLNDNNILI